MDIGWYQNLIILFLLRTNCQTQFFIYIPMKARKQERDFGQDLRNIVPMQSLTRKRVKEDCSLRDQNSSYLESRRTEVSKKILRRRSQRQRSDAVDQYQEQIIKFTFNYFSDIMSHNREQLTTRSGPILDGKENLPPTNTVEAGREGAMIQAVKVGKRAKGLQLLAQGEQIFPTHSPNISNSNRKVLVSWLIEVHEKMRLRYETLYLTLNILDRFCKGNQIDKSNYQLLGITCLFIAGKYEEIATPKLRKIVSLCDGLFSAKDVLAMESSIMLSLDFLLSQPSVNWFIGTYITFLRKETEIERSRMREFEKTCCCVAEFTLFHFEIMEQYLPHIISATIVFTVSLFDNFLEFNISHIESLLSSDQLTKSRQCSLLIKKLIDNIQDEGPYKVVKAKYYDLNFIKELSSEQLKFNPSIPSK